MRTLHRIILLSLAISAIISTSACVSAKKYRSLEEKVGQLESQLTDKDIDLQRMTAEKLKADSALQAAQTNNPGEDKTNKYTDSDSDGVPDYKDWEPYSPAGAKVDSKGVTVVKPAPKDEEPEAPTDKLPVITFSPYSVQLDKDALETLEQFAASLTKKKFSKLEVIGHASDYNQATKNADLAKRRATTVKDALVDYGVEPTKMVVATKDMADAAAQPGVQAFVAFKFGTGAVTPEKPAVDDKPAKEEKPTPPAAGKGTYHDVVKGDTLYNISKRYNTTVDNIKRLNNMKDNNVKIGTKIRVQ